MKIGEFSQKFNVPIATVRHYIKLGLLVPEKDGFQYSFTESDCREMEIIIEMKAAGFKLNELNRYLSIFRFYNKDDYLLYEKLITSLDAKKSSLYEERRKINKYISLINEKIEELESNSSNAMNKSADPYSMADITGSTPLPGFPINAVNLLCCPHCQSKMDISGVDISGTSIINGSLSCCCGYQATIRDGIMYTDGITDLENDPEFLEWYFGEENLITNEDGMILMAMNECSDQFLINMHKDSRWIHRELKNFDSSEKTILFPDISLQYLYNYYDNDKIDDCTLLVTALSEKTIHTMRQHIANANPNLNIAYIINQNGQLPLKQKCIDIIIDYIGTTNLGFFSKEHYFDTITPYISDDAIITGAIDYYSKGRKSLSKIHQTYSHASPKVMTLEFTKDALQNNSFEIEKFEKISEGYDPGSFFEYHTPGDIRCNMVYLATRKSK